MYKIIKKEHNLNSIYNIGVINIKNENSTNNVGSIIEVRKITAIFNNCYYLTETYDVGVGRGTITGLTEWDSIEDFPSMLEVVYGDGTNSTGNQFVWVPVSQEDFDTVFVRRKGYFNGIEQDLTNYGEADSTGKNLNPEVKESSTTQQEAKQMYASVKANGGFYIGRYEAGTTSETPRTSNVAEDVVIKKGANVYNYVTWSKNGTINEANIVEETENNPVGAVELARNFGIKNGYKTVTSTLCYGVQWDATLTWIAPEYDDFARNSDGMGWYSGVEGNESHKIGIDLKDGENIKNMTKKIYDLAGNVWEWTMESYGDSSRVTRGGSYLNSGSESPASYRRIITYPSSSNPNIDFRVTSYL